MPETVPHKVHLISCAVKACVSSLPAAVLVCLAVILASAAPAAWAQSPETQELLRRIYSNQEFAAKTFGPIQWEQSGEAFDALEPSPGAAGVQEIVRYETATGKREVLIAAKQLIPPGAEKPLAVENFAWSSDRRRALLFTNSRRVWRQNTRGDYWVFDRETRSLRKIGGDAPASSLMFTKFSSDGSRVAYVRQNDLYAEDVQSGTVTRLTRDGSATIINGTSDWVYEEELSVRDAFRWSPDGNSIAYWQFDSSGVREFTLLYPAGGPYDIVTHVPYPEYGVYAPVVRIPIPQPGTLNSAARIGVVKATGGETKWMQVPGDPRNTYIARMDWAGNSDEIALQHLNRLQNTNDVMIADAKTGAVRLVHSDHDAAWVDVVDDFRWLREGKEFLWVSEHDGWRHAYVNSRDGKQTRLLTPGAFDILGVEGIDLQGGWLYFAASPDNASQRYLYRSRLDGRGTPERLTPGSQPGMHHYNFSPDSRWALEIYTTFDTPPVTSLLSIPGHQVARVLEDNADLRAKLKPFIHHPTEFFQVDIGEGVKLDAWMIKPRGFDLLKKYPILVYVYGEPAGQTVLDGFDDDRGLFHRALAEQGYVIVSFDNRGTPAPKGRAWRKMVYGSVGVLSSKDQAAALREFERTRPFVDSGRVAVWGWSGGGSSTLNLMFRFPELYKVGMSVAPVPDERLYDSIYQERYMGLPQENASGYESGSPINFADGLRGNLLLVHGSGDDNVHFQGSELLINRLIELGKQFDFMEYPGRTHAILEGPGTRYHLYSLLARYLEMHLPPGPGTP